MAEVLFYHLERSPLDDVLPELLERTLARGQRAVVRVDSADRAEALDGLMWTWKDDSFLPHAQSGDCEPERQPIVITSEAGNPNRSEVLFLIGGAPPRFWSQEHSVFARIVVLFEGRDESQVALARVAWLSAREAGIDATYWKQSAAGKWEKQT